MTNAELLENTCARYFLPASYTYIYFPLPSNAQKMKTTSATQALVHPTIKQIFGTFPKINKENIFLVKNYLLESQFLTLTNC